MQGSPESCVGGRTLLYQLILIQAVCEKRGDFAEVPALVNNHPMLQDSALTDSQSAKLYYLDLLNHYGIVGAKQEPQEPLEPVPEDTTVPKVEDVEMDPHPDMKQHDAPKPEPAESDPAEPGSAQPESPPPESTQLESPQPTQPPRDPHAPVDPVELDRLVNTLYMKYSQQLLEAIDADKKEFNQVLETIKPK